MKRWLQQLLLELRLLRSQWYFLLLPIPYGVWLAIKLSSLAPPASENLFTYLFQFHSMQFVLTLGVAMVLGITLARRDVHRTAYVWLESLPVSFFTQVTAKYIAGLSCLSLFTLVMSLVVLLFGRAREIPFSVLADHVMFFIVQAEISYAVTLALAMALGTFISNRISYLIGFCAWMFGTFFLDMVVISSYQWFPLLTFHLSQFTLDSMLESELWGYPLFKDELATSRLFVLCFTLLLLIAVIAYLNRLRPSSRRRFWMITALSAAVLTSASYLPNGLLWKERYAGYMAVLHTSPSLEELENNEANEPLLFSVQSYQMDVSRQSNENVQIHARLELPFNEYMEARQPLSFTLNAQFQLRQAIVNGNPVDISRDGEFLTLDADVWNPDLAIQTVELNYEGQVFEWMVFDNYPAVLSFVDDNQVYLPAHAAWYPVPGKQHRFASFNSRHLLSLGDKIGLLDSTAFDVTVSGFSSRLYATLPENEASLSPSGKQQFRGEVKDGLTLAGGNFIEVSAPGEPVTIVTTPSNKREAERFIDKLNSHLDYYRSWLDNPLTQIDYIFYYQQFTHGPHRYRNFAGITGNTLYFAESISGNLDNYRLGNAVNSILFYDTVYHYYSEPDNPNLAGIIRSAFPYLYLRDEKGLSDNEISQGAYANIYPLLHPNKSENGGKIYSMIDEAIEQGKTDKVKQVLNEFHRRGLTMKGTDYSMEISTGEELLITFEDWLKVWDQVMANG